MRRITPLPGLLAILAAALSLMAACEPAAPTGEPFVVADLFATPGKALATVALSPTPSATPTIPNVPSPTPAPTLPLPTVSILRQPTLPIGTFAPQATRSPLEATPGPLVCAGAPPMPFTPIWQNIAQAQSLMRCPKGDLKEVAGVWQGFEYGAMFWRERDRSIFVLSELGTRQGQPTDTWWRVDDTWSEGEPEFDPGLAPPEGLRQPVRGFGKVWRGNGFIREALGWAIGEEVSVTILWQEFDGGWMMTGPQGAPIFVLAPTDPAPHSTGIHLGSLP